MNDTCVCCGEYVPEGRMVCPVCTGKNDIENGVFQTLDKRNPETTVAKEKHKRS